MNIKNHYKIYNKYRVWIYNVMVSADGHSTTDLLLNSIHYGHGPELFSSLRDVNTNLLHIQRNTINAYIS